MIIASKSQALNGADDVWDIGDAITSGATFVPGSSWPLRIVVTNTTAVAVSAALEYVNSGLAAPTSTSDGPIPLTSATMTGAYLIAPGIGAQETIFVKPQAVQMKINLKVHVFGASGAVLIEAQRY